MDAIDYAILCERGSESRVRVLPAPANLREPLSALDGGLIISELLRADYPLLTPWLCMKVA